MRRHRYLRGGYRAGNVKKSKKKILIRIAFVIICALLLLLVSVLLGNHLKKKADSSLSLSTGNDYTEDTSDNIKDFFPDGIPVKDPSEASRELCAASIDITSADAETLCDMIDSLSDEYNAVSFRINSSDGKLVYISPALMDYVGLDASLIDTRANITTNDEDETPKSFDVYENLREVIIKAKAKGLRTVALYETDGRSLEHTVEGLSAREIDSIIAGELTALGCDEILIDGLYSETGQLPHETLRAIISYLAALRTRSESTLIGLNFPDHIYLIPQNASVIKTLSEYADVLAISISSSSSDPDEAYSLVYDNCYSLKGNFSMYNLRCIIVSDSADAAVAIHASLKALYAKSFQYTLYVENPTFEPSVADETTSDGTETGVSNDNANRKEDYLAAEDNLPSAE